MQGDSENYNIKHFILRAPQQLMMNGVVDNAKMTNEEYNFGMKISISVAYL